MFGRPRLDLIRPGRIDAAFANLDPPFAINAGAAIAKAHGLHISHADGSPLLYNQENPYLPDLLICRKELADKVLAAQKA